MHRRSRSIAAALAAVLTLGAPQVASAAPTDPPSAPPTGAPAGPAGPDGARTTTVTLVTGDRVTLAGERGVAVRPGQGRERVRFLVQRTDRGVSVLPTDALPLLRSGKVDRRLFDVTGLVAAGYDDARRDDLPLLVRYRSGADARAARPELPGVRVTRELPAISGAALSADKDRAEAVWSALTSGPVTARTDTVRGIDRIWLDGRRRVTLDHSVPQIGAPAAHQAGLTGRGVRVAVLDTGIDATHPDLAGRVAEARNFTEAPDTTDQVGHGTHVASTIAGSGAASGGRYRGVAPDATLFSGKVCADTSCSDSAILAGMQWAAVDQRATVINVSLGGYDTPEIDPLEEAVNSLTASTGALFVIAAGNSGSDASIGSPGSADAALTVGAVDREDELADFSSRGPRTGDDALKPDLTAPGVDIVAARAAGTTMGDPVGEGYVAASGTSMATPHVVGSVALLAQQHPDWRADRFKAALTASAEPHPELTAFEQGAGRVDVGRAIGQVVTSDPVGLSLGRTEWPHGDDEPFTRTVAWRNAGTTPLTLDLALEATGPTGQPAPAGLFTLDTTRVTVPAGGRAEATLTTDTRIEGPDGFYTGRIVATAGTQRSVTALAVNREPESYPVTVRLLDRTGAPATDGYVSLLGLGAHGVWDFVPGPDGTATLRIPKGRYGLAGYVFEGSDQMLTAASMIAQSELRVDGPVTVTVDARKARPVRLSVPEPGARAELIFLDANFFGEEAGYGWGLFADDTLELRTAGLGGRVPADRFVATLGSQWLRPGEAPSPYLYSTSEAFPGRFPTGYERDYQRRELAQVTHRFRGGYPGLSNERLVFGEFDRYPVGAAAVVRAVQVPGQRVEYHNTRGLKWWSELAFGTYDADGWLETKVMLSQPPAAFRPGSVGRQVWNEAPYGPSFTPLSWPGQGIFRTGDQVEVWLPTFSDQAGHPGGAETDRSRTALYRDGKLVGEELETGWFSFPVPPAAGDYRLERVDERSHIDLATRVASVWTFRSGHTGEEQQALPVMAIQFRPALREDNSAPAGRSLVLPVQVQRQPGAPAATVRSLTVEVSHDAGKTWRQSQVQRVGNQWIAGVGASGPGYVSLRATARDSAGNTATQEIIQAYRLR